MALFSKGKRQSATADNSDDNEQQQRKQLQDVLKRRAKLAEQLESNAHERAVLLSQWIKADEQLHELERAGVTSPNANRNMWTVGQALTYLEYSDRKAGVTLGLEGKGGHGAWPYCGRSWTDRTSIPTLAEYTANTNQTIAGE